MIAPATARRDDGVRAADVVVTVGRGESGPVPPGKRYEDRDIRDAVQGRVSAGARARDLSPATTRQEDVAAIHAQQPESWAESSC